MLSFEQMNIINEQLQQENAHEFIEKIIMCYATVMERISELLSLIPKIADKQLKIKQERIQDYAWAYDLLLGERYRYPIPKRKSKIKKEYNSDFPTLLYGCKAHFPNGNCNGGSQADKEFFEEFIEIVRNRIDFDYESKDDWEWICNVANCRAWMLEVIRQNIDSKFVEPEVRIRRR